MSASYDLTPEQENARDALHNAEEGDEVIWGDRVEPLTVMDVGGTSEDEDHYLVVQGPRGGTYTINEYYTPSGAPDFRTDSGEQTNDLRIVSEQGDPDNQSAVEGDSGGVNPGETSTQTTLQEDDDGRDGPGHSWPSPPESSRELDADSFVQEYLDDPLATYQDLVAGNVEDKLPSNPISKFLDRQDSWTFLDELLASGHDVPKTVNNWHLIDYGLVTDDAVNNTRKLAWYNTSENDLLMLVAVQTGDGPEWLVYHTETPQDIPSGDRDPVLRTSEFSTALDAIEEYLYGTHDEVDLSVQETPSGDVTVVDAISNSKIAEKVMSVRGADPFGIRGYVASTSTPEFIMDLDSAIYDSLAAARAQAETTAGRLTRRIREWWRNNRGSMLQQLGERVKVAIMLSVVGMKRRFTGIDVRPVIQYDRLGILAEYRYRGKKGETPTAELTVDPSEGQVPGLAAFDPESDSHSRLASLYIAFVNTAQWAQVNEWWFNIPAPWNVDADQNQVHAGSVDTRTTGSSRGREAVAEHLRGETADEMTPDEINADRLDNVLDDLDDRATKHTVALYALAARADAELTEYGLDSLSDGYGSREAKREFLAEEIYPIFEDALKQHNPLDNWVTNAVTSTDEGQYPSLNVVIDALDEYYDSGSASLVDALHEAIIDSPVSVPEKLRSPKDNDFAFDLSSFSVLQRGTTDTDEASDGDGEGSPGTPMPEAAVDAATSSDGEDGGARSTSGGGPRNTDVNRLAEKMEQGIVDPGDLTDDEVEMLRDASVEVDELPFDEADRSEIETLERRLNDDEEDAVPGSLYSSADAVDDRVDEATDDIQGASEAAKDTWREQMYADDPTEFADYENRDDEFDRLP